MITDPATVLSRAPVVPVLTIERLDDAVPLARALLDGGLPVLEVTLRSSAALPAIQRIRHELPEALVGAGTVLDGDGLHAVAQAGGLFAISPGSTDALYSAAHNAPIPLIPGIASASELMRGLEHGFEVFKFFPAEAAGGVAALKSLAGPFAQARFCPTGGINPNNARNYLALPNVLTVGGSWMVPNDAIAAADWPRITQLAREAAALRAG